MNWLFVAVGYTYNLVFALGVDFSVIGACILPMLGALRFWFCVEVFACIALCRVAFWILVLTVGNLEFCF